MLEADKERAVVRIQSATYRKPRQSDERPRLLIATVLGKAGNDIANRGAEWIRFADALDEVSGGLVGYRTPI
jgi:hypothetical protein